MSRPDIHGILGADFCLSSDVSSHGFLNALAILPTQVSRIINVSIIIIIILMSRPDIHGILGADFCLSSDVSSHGFLNALAILPTQVSRIMGALPCLKQNLMSAL